MTTNIIFLVILLSVSLAAGLIAGKIMDKSYEDDDVVVDDNLCIYLKRNE